MYYRGREFFIQCCDCNIVNQGNLSPRCTICQQAEAKKVKLLEEAEIVITPLARAVKRGIATDEEQKRLDAWELYSVLVSRVDTSDPDWPEKPASL